MRPPALVIISAAASAVVGACAIGLGLRNLDPWFVAAGVALLALAAGLWIGFRPARWGALIAGVLALPVGIYGLGGLAAVVEQRRMCDGLTATASIVAASYPADFCTTVNWFTQFGIGFALLGVGITGLVLLATAATDGEHFNRPMRLRAAAPE